MPLRRAAALLGLPVKWLRREADGGRLPCLRVGRRRLFDIEVVRRALDDRARPAAGQEGGPRGG